MGSQVIVYSKELLWKTLGKFAIEVGDPRYIDDPIVIEAMKSYQSAKESTKEKA